MIYVDFSVLDSILTHWEIKDCMDQYREWLELNAGVEEQAWKWNRGDLTARGVYIQDHQVALMLRLKFGL